MKIMSEKTGLEYPNVDACIAAEKEYDEKIAKQKADKEAEQKALIAKKEAALANRKAAAAVVEDKRKALLAAQKDFKDALSKFCDEYGAYHYTIKDGDDAWFSLFDNLFYHLWF